MRAAAWHRLREARAEREAAQVAWMYNAWPWVRGYAIMRPGRDWRAVHLATSRILPPARTPADLGRVILADVQARPVTPPVPVRPGIPAGHAQPLQRGGGRL